jgi:hypothetical protein
MRPRDLETLEATTYDVLVIGGGIHGLTVAYDSASRGLRTAVIDANDIGSAASFNHQKTVHGGLRSLQYGRLGYARAACAPCGLQARRVPGPGSQRRRRARAAPARGAVGVKGRDAAPVSAGSARKPDRGRAVVRLSGGGRHGEELTAEPRGARRFTGTRRSIEKGGIVARR